MAALRLVICHLCISTQLQLSMNSITVLVLTLSLIDMSIKSSEREKQGKSVALEVKIYGLATPLPKQWDKSV